MTGMTNSLVRHWINYCSSLLHVVAIGFQKCEVRRPMARHRSNRFSPTTRVLTGISSERGATLIEYILIPAVGLFCAIGVIGSVGQNANDTFSAATLAFNAYATDSSYHDTGGGTTGTTGGDGHSQTGGASSDTSSGGGSSGTPTGGAHYSTTTRIGY